MLSSDKRKLLYFISNPIHFSLDFFGFLIEFSIKDFNTYHYKIEGFDFQFYSILEAENFASENDIILDKRVYEL